MKQAGVFIFILLLLAPVWGKASQQEQVVEIRVVQGDTLGQLCRTYLLDLDSWKEIARLNRLPNPNLIYPGQVIIIPVRFLKAGPSEGKASFLRGKAEILAPPGKDWLPIVVGDRIPQGSTVRTLEASALEIVFENGDTCFLRPQTTLGMTTTTREGDTWIRRLFLQAGKIITRIQKATGTQTRFVISTPSAQCAARGTIFRATADPDDMTRSEVLEGTVAIEAGGARIDVAENFGTATKTGAQPLPPRPLLPGPVLVKLDSPYKRMPFGLSFKTPPGTVNVLAALTKDMAGQDAAVESIFKPDQMFLVAGLEDGLYYLQCRAIDGLGLEGIPAPPLEIRIRTMPRPPLLQGIAAQSQLRCGSPSIRWAAVSGAAGYQLQLAKDPGFALLNDRIDTFNTSWTPASLATGDYYVRARSIAEDGYEGDWSAPIGFSILPPYSSPVLEKPKREDAGFRLRWNGFGPGVLYRVQVAKDENFTTLVHQEIVRTTETLVPEPAESGRYYARVKAFDGAGCESEFSSWQKFRVGGFWSFILTPCTLAPLGVLIYLLAR